MKRAQSKLLSKEGLVKFSRNAVVALLQCVPLRRSTIAKVIRLGELDTLYWIDPGTVVSQVARGAEAPNLGRKFVTKDSSWETDLIEPVGKGLIRKTIEQLLFEQRDPKYTEQYSYMLNGIHQWEENGSIGYPYGAYWCRSETDIDSYFDILLRAIEDIRENGCRTQREIMNLRKSDSRSEFDEIQVVIGADGTRHLYLGGTHRTLLAQIFGITTVPVRVMAVNDSWSKRHLRSRIGSLERRLREALEANA